jgi:prophage antirepressor-like protein
MNIPTEYKNLSAIAKASGTRLNDWVNRSVGKKAIADFKLKYPEIDQPLVTKKGKGGGTWVHPELAAIFAAWCNPKFTAEVVEQNVQLKEQNVLLKEKIRTFQVDTPAQIADRLDEVVEVKRMAHQVADKGIEEVELIVIHCLFKDQEIRFVDGSPVANDVAAVLGYKDPANAVNRLVKSKNKGVCDLQTPRGIQSVAVLKEAGIYQLIFGSKLASAEEFQDWVFEDVLPSIRKTGSYSLNKPKKEQNALLKEKIRTFQVNTPAQIDSVRDEAEKVKQMAYNAKEKTEEEIELIAKCHFVQNSGMHPKGITFEQYLPHWLFSMRERTDGVYIYPPAILNAMLAKTGQPARCQGKVLKPGYAGVWVAEIN